MKSPPTRRLLLVLFALLGLNIVSWLLMISARFDARALGVAALVIAFVKVRLIVIHYMDVALAQLPVRIAFEAWVCVVGGITITLYVT